MKKIIISGSQGFIGNNLKNLFIQNGYKVYGIDKKINHIRMFNHVNTKNNYYFYKYDLSKNLNLIKFIDKFKNIKFDSYWHFAANSDISKGSKDINIEIKDTFFSTKNSLEIAKKLKIKKFIFASSSAIFGSVNHKINENHGPCLPESNYGAMKLSSEAIISTYAIFFEKIYIARFPNVVGADNTHGLIFDMIRKSQNTNKIKVLGNGFQKKPYIHVNDLIKILFKIYKKDTSEKINIFNIGPDDSGITVRQIINKLSKLKIFAGKKFMYEKKSIGWVGDISKYSYDISKIKKLLKLIKLNSSNAAINVTIKEIKKITE